MNSDSDHSDAANPVLPVEQPVQDNDEVQDPIRCRVNIRIGRHGPRAIRIRAVHDNEYMLNFRPPDTLGILVESVRAILPDDVVWDAAASPLRFKGPETIQSRFETGILVVLYLIIFLVESLIDIYSHFDGRRAAHRRRSQNQFVLHLWVYCDLRNTPVQAQAPQAIQRATAGRITSARERINNHIATNPQDRVGPMGMQYWATSLARQRDPLAPVQQPQHNAFVQITSLDDQMAQARNESEEERTQRLNEYGQLKVNMNGVEQFILVNKQCLREILGLPPINLNNLSSFLDVENPPPQVDMEDIDHASDNDMNQ
jgi:hypothetical protein